jgi:uncharacterized protein (TIGR03435 family)
VVTKLFAVGLILFDLGVAFGSQAQSQATGPAFEVASIRPHPGLPLSVRVSVSGSLVTVREYPLLGLIMDAYQLRSYQILGGPAWLESDRFDIVARAPGEGPPTDAQLRMMMQKLLAERFQLKFHRETKQMPVYALTVGKGGPKLKKSAPDAEPLFQFSGGLVTAITVTKQSMEEFAKHLGSSGVDRPVVDKTGLTSEYSFTLNWSADQTQSTGALDAPSIFTAIQEQLGLKLEPAKGPVDLLTIDSARKPSLD